MKVPYAARFCLFIMAKALVTASFWPNSQRNVHQTCHQTTFLPDDCLRLDAITFGTLRGFVDGFCSTLSIERFDVINDF